MPDDAPRLFVALWPSPAVRSALAASLPCWDWPARAACVRPDNLHLTLHFLGHVAAARVEALAEAIDVPFAPFEIEVRGAELWRGGIAVRETTLPPCLLALHASLAEALQRLGFEPDPRPYRPHVTLARHAQGARAPAVLEPARWPVDGHALVRSAGGDYTVLRRYPRTSASG